MKNLLRSLVTVALLMSVSAGALAANGEREILAAQLAAHGVSRDEAAARVAALTDEEVAALAGRVDQLPAGGDAGVVLFLALIGVLALHVVEGAVMLASMAVDTVRCGFVDALLRNCPREDR